MNEADTICALATAPGGALGVIRISGPDAIPIVDNLFHAANGKPLTTRTGYSLVYGTLHAANDDVLDDVIVSLFRSPNSYTGEDSVEISCHGSRYILNKVLEELILSGCRMARAGEFSQRAFLNGKMDLSQAEAVADLISATNKATHDIALSQLRGHFSSQLKVLREQLLRLTSLLELELDFSDHEDIEFADRSELTSLTQTIDSHINQLVHSFEIGQAIKQGIPVAIVGKTNVGKSTLLNRLLKDDRAIVSDIHGTTRDTIEDTIDIQGITFRIIDTAGLRQTTDEVERIGISRTYAAIEKARIVLWLIDQQPSVDDISEMLQASNGKSLIIIQNKIDKNEPINLLSLLPDDISNITFLQISAKHNQHLDTLEQAIYKAADIPTLSDSDVIVTNARHYEALIKAEDSLKRVLDGLHSGLPGDLLAEDLHITLSSLADITGGVITPQETLNNIFQHFCVGK